MHDWNQVVINDACCTGGCMHMPRGKAVKWGWQAAGEPPSMAATRTTVLQAARRPCTHLQVFNHALVIQQPRAGIVVTACKQGECGMVVLNEISCSHGSTGAWQRSVQAS